MKNNKGVTLVEIIIATALIFIVLPIIWNYIISSVEDTATLNDKMAVQGSVNALMTQLQRDIQEARCPINPNTSKYIKIHEGSFKFLICKPNSNTNNDGKPQNVVYEWNKDKKIVTLYQGVTLIPPKTGSNTSETEYDVDLDEEGIDIATYDYISDIELKKVGNNGIDVYIRGEISEKAGYTLNNTYYTRNTVF